MKEREREEINHEPLNNWIGRKNNQKKKDEKKPND